MVVLETVWNQRFFVASASLGAGLGFAIMLVLEEFILEWFLWSVALIGFALAIHLFTEPIEEDEEEEEPTKGHDGWRPMGTTRTVYACQYCHKMFHSYQVARTHEDACPFGTNVAPASKSSMFGFVSRPFDPAKQHLAPQPENFPKLESISLEDEETI